MIRVVVADDHPIVRTGIAGLLDTEPDFEVVGEAASGEEAIALAAETAPHVVLMDLRMPGMGGVEATRRIVRSGHASAPRVLVFTTYEDDDQILAAIEAGASGYLVKAAPAEEVAAGVRAVVAGQTVLAPSVAVALAQAARGGVGDPGAAADTGAAPDPVPNLTPREREILTLVAQGLSNPQIAARLFIGESTVKTHLLHVFEKLGVSDRTRAAIRALELRLI
ncbi:response regulator [Leucobacter massiliensis]|uniref:DNA-binding response regulator n=1 Tax=Leucobacter massiliensis TaxID=1686285 RepID=A0A2S9QS90_9MICO|nr:response regulator transcription factor [Leucobacter massiliensis]PRI12438.1 DNA-binding response regulator [Leucobacter massiliensis]